MKQENWPQSKPEFISACPAGTSAARLCVVVSAGMDLWLVSCFPKLIKGAERICGHCIETAGRTAVGSVIIFRALLIVVRNILNDFYIVHLN